MKRNCEECGDEFVVPARRPKQIYCSRRCSNRTRDMSAIRAKRVNNFAGVPTKKKPCAYCSELYQPTSSNQRYCTTCVPHGRARKNMRAYGISEPEFQEAYNKQNGCCAICGKPDVPEDRIHKLLVDHCHVTGKFRGLVCRSCNMALGYIDNKEWLARAIEYVGGDHVTSQRAQGC